MKQMNHPNLVSTPLKSPARESGGRAPGFRFLPASRLAVSRLAASCVAAAAVASLGLVPDACASGTYPPPSPAKPPINFIQRANVDAHSYETGKLVFDGRAPLAPLDQAAVAEQAAVLKRWQSKLPWRLRFGDKLSGLAGRLSGEQMKYLAYYLAVRFKMQTA